MGGSGTKWLTVLMCREEDMLRHGGGESCCVRGKYLDHISVIANKETKILESLFKKMSAAFS